MARIRPRRRMREASNSSPATDVRVWRAAANVKPRSSVTIWVNSFAIYLRRIINRYTTSNHKFCALGFKWSDSIYTIAPALFLLAPDQRFGLPLDFSGESLSQHLLGQ